MISEQLLPWFNSDLLTSLAISDYSCAPLIARALAIKILHAGTVARVYVNASGAPIFMSQLRPGANMAIAIEQPSTHRSMQIKGNIVAIDVLQDNERQYCKTYQAAFAKGVERFGFTAHMSSIFLPDPDDSALALDVAIMQVYEQTPGPDAGCQLVSA